MTTRTAAKATIPDLVCTPNQVEAGAESKTSKDVKVQLTYLKDDPLYETVKPLQITPNFADTEHKTNVRLEPGQLETLHDVRGLSGSPLGNFSLDDHGFKYVKAPTTFTEWGSQPKIAQSYLPELEKLLRQEVEGCDEVLFYDARIRQAGDEGLRVEGLSYNPFARQVHTDNTERSVIEKITAMTEMKAEFLLSGRARIINIWRPIKHPVYDCGLAIADGGTLREDDVIECERHLAKTGEYWDTMGVIRYRPGFDWYYCSEQAEEDVLLFKNFDTAKDVKARICLHTAFDMPADTITTGAPTRESIEGHLERLDDEHVITDRLRTDIDEAKEVKDAMLVWRRMEMKKLEQLVDQRTRERDEAIARLQESDMNRQSALVVIQQLQKEVAAFKKDMAAVRNELRSEQRSISRRKESFDSSDRRVPDEEYEAMRNELNAMYAENGRLHHENVCLSDQVTHQARNIQKWTAELVGQGNEAVTRSWQGSVDKAVQSEREKDAFVIKNLRDEIERLRRK
ncbi:hypothetical protein LTR56_017611 [Elasticomyces elasticus]|nr:hypothetical protein LTR22_026092 [Elasticomyces elasticus]KAK3630197.1 hypothetical protein LTR56_017611 [Elasticomyces elasticus]KAK4903980.1 hypothetical protein LTR49_026482 [Elasticomyces elasticus]KAK5757760.1 hypothetical protein LTS12_012078 [Elasticomyces elasticus]